MTSNGSLFTQIKNEIATITFGHSAGNSFPSELLNRLVNELNILDKNENIKVILLKSEGDKIFCSGASFDELLSITNESEGLAFFSGFAHVINAMRTCQKIIVGRVLGKAVGGGVGIIAACDYVMATEQAAIKLSEISIGIGPFVIQPAIERKAGKAAFSHLSLSPQEWKNAYWAEKQGLYAKVFETQKELEKEVDLYTHQLATYSTEALSELKKTLWEGTENWNDLLIERAKISGKLVLSETTKKALQQFKK
jgi:methylglutaconyl-CoA hydratase